MGTPHSVRQINGIIRTDGLFKYNPSVFQFGHNKRNVKNDYEEHTYKYEPDSHKRRPLLFMMYLESLCLLGHRHV